MKSTMKLHKLSDSFAQTKTAQNFAAAIEHRVVQARQAEFQLTTSGVSSTALHMTGRAA